MSHTVISITKKLSPAQHPSSSKALLNQSLALSTATCKVNTSLPTLFNSPLTQQLSINSSPQKPLASHSVCSSSFFPLCFDVVLTFFCSLALNPDFLSPSCRLLLFPLNIALGCLLFSYYQTILVVCLILHFHFLMFLVFLMLILFFTTKLASSHAAKPLTMTHGLRLREARQSVGICSLINNVVKLAQEPNLVSVDSPASRLSLSSLKLSHQVSLNFLLTLVSAHAQQRSLCSCSTVAHHIGEKGKIKGVGYFQRRIKCKGLMMKPFGHRAARIVSRYFIYDRLGSSSSLLNFDFSYGTAQLSWLTLSHCAQSVGSQKIAQDYSMHITNPCIKKTLVDSQNNGRNVSG
ncbi:hypothetical protein VP01_83g6 [Puccinia sorghi]|uniref:Uncharacterized protein n=1 Tax=Puccinia sorghi TaxID=27349 RepID=A0A0L6U9E7_9BASI|nr:hypothetical protein VP01_83g6 [Puccinia sorghi]